MRGGKNKIVWTPEMDAVLLEGRRRKMRNDVLAAQIGVALGTMYARLRELGQHVGMKPITEEVRRLWFNPYITAKEIEKRVGITAERLRRELGSKPRRKAIKPEASDVKRRRGKRANGCGNHRACGGVELRDAGVPASDEVLAADAV